MNVVPVRTCEACGSKLPFARQRVRNDAGQLVCPGCAAGAPGTRMHGSLDPVVAHDSGDGETIYHCGRASERYWTYDGLKTLGETVGTIQKVLVNTGAGGVWRDAMVHSFGEQPLMKVVLRRNKQIKETYWTPEHRWLVRVRQDPNRKEARTVSTIDLQPGDRLAWLLPKSAIATSTPSPFGIAHGIVYGDGTRAAKGSVVRLWGEKDAQLLRYFSESRTSPVKTPAGVLGQMVLDLPAFFKDRPSLDESIPYLYGWLAGYFAADGCVDSSGTVKLSSASIESLEFAQLVATRLGIGTFGIYTKSRLGFGTEPSELHDLSFIGSTLKSEFFLTADHRRRYDRKYQGREVRERIGWTVESVEHTDLVEEVFCPRVPEHENFVLEGFINTENCPFCGGGQVWARSDGTTECDFCESAFTVQVQPMRSAMPQTVNGQPVEIPGMPGEAGSNADALAEASAPDAPFQPPDSEVAAFDPPAQQVAAHYVTGSGAALDDDAFVRHLAIAHADDREAVIAQVRADLASTDG